MQNNRQSLIWNFICVLLFLMVGVVRLLRPINPNCSDNAVVFVLFVFSLAIWTDRTRQRIAVGSVGRYITAVSLLILLLMILRTVKFIFLSDGHLLARLSWYAYYISMSFLPLFLLFAVLYTGRPYGYTISRKWFLLYIPATLLSVLFLTNDLHQKAFLFPGGIHLWDDEPYRYGPVYLAECIWVAVVLITILTVTFKRCVIAEYRRKIWMPVLPLVLGMAYTVCYLFFPGALFQRLYKFAEMIAFIFPAFLEGLIQAHLFPSNDCYENLWKVSDLKFGIMDKNGRIVYQSEKGLPVTLNEVVLSEKQEVFTENENLVLRSSRIAGGYSFWFKDITEINQINSELMGLGDVIAEENAILEAENELSEKRSRIAEQARLYNGISEDVAPQLEALSGILSSPPEDEPAFQKRMKEAAILQVYIKRRSNLLLLSSEKAFLSAMELWVSVKESLSYIALADRAAYGEYEGDCGIETEAEKILFLYRAFEEITEAAMPGLSAVFLRLGFYRDAFVMRIELATPSALLPGDYEPEKRRQLNAEFSIETENNNLGQTENAYVYVRMPVGGA